MNTEKLKLVRTKIGTFSILFTSLMYIVAGISLILYQPQDPKVLSIIILTYGALITIGEIGATFNHFRITKLLIAFLPLLFTIIIVYYQHFASSIFVFLLGIYMMVIALFRYIDFYYSNRNKVKGRFIQLFITIIITLVGLPMIFNASMHIKTAFLITGIFCVFYGITLFNDFMLEITPKDKIDYMKGRIRINLPIVFTAIMPLKMSRYINSLLATEKDGVIIEDSYKSRQDEDPDLEVLIHVAPKGFGAMGHGDIWFDGNIHCYGNYDESSLRLFGAAGDGVYFKADDRLKYIHFYDRETGATIFAYGLRLNEQQKAKIKQCFDDLESHMYQWYPKAYEFKRQPDLFQKAPEDYASMLYEATNAKFYKFKDTEWKTYFVMTTNCTKLVDYVLSQIGQSGVVPNGIVTPGAYYDYFEHLYSMENSIVISKRTYRTGVKIEHQVD